jgi:SAM-dependent methyltransferase
MEVDMLKNAYQAFQSLLEKLGYRRDVREGRPQGEDWHREAVGGGWEWKGKYQFDFLVNQGLKPSHYLLDIGCGSLRGGVHFIKYLNATHYYGIEKEKSLLEAGRGIELKRCGLEHKAPHLLLTDGFDLSSIPEDVEFDFMLAQSVFTHLLPDMIELCLVRVTPRLRQTGVFYATFFESEDSRIDYGNPHSWRRNERNAAKYPFSLFQEIAGKVGVSVEHLGDWYGPGIHKMLAFRRRDR